MEAASLEYPVIHTPDMFSLGTNDGRARTFARALADACWERVPVTAVGVGDIIGDVDDLMQVVSVRTEGDRVIFGEVDDNDESHLATWTVQRLRRDLVAYFNDNAPEPR